MDACRQIQRDYEEIKREKFKKGVKLEAGLLINIVLKNNQSEADD